MKDAACSALWGLAGGLAAWAIGYSLQGHSDDAAQRLTVATGRIAETERRLDLHRDRIWQIAEKHNRLAAGYQLLLTHLDLHIEPAATTETPEHLAPGTADKARTRCRWLHAPRPPYPVVCVPGKDYQEAVGHTVPPTWPVSESELAR